MTSTEMLEKYTKAKEDVAKQKVKDNFIIMQVSYDQKLVIPYKEGMELISALSKAEVIHLPYTGPHRIKPVEQDTFEFNVMSHVEYEKYKMIALLGLEKIADLAPIEDALNPPF